MRTPRAGCNLYLSLVVAACDCDPKGSTTQFCNPRSGKCTCRENVFGDRCDQCAPGFWGDPWSCTRCECNGRAETCDPKTGACINCRENTNGDHCDQCAEGHYGDPMRGIPCQPCECPGRAEIGPNHAISCHLSRYANPVVYRLSQTDSPINQPKS